MPGVREVAAEPEPAVPASRALGDDLGVALGAVFRCYVQNAEAVLGQLPGGPRGYQVLDAASRQLAEGQGALARRLGIDRTVMTYLVDDLERAGLVERRPDVADRRNKQVVATKRGRAVWARTRTRLQLAEGRVLDPLAPAERAEFRRLLARLAERALALHPVDDPCELVAGLDPDAADARP
ncbi:MAG TPA: MarR family transcriptional regulator [Acidimicrobiales bacterium]|nr:MarR family transcriptional regulator [Acidimicrobiales bacterium]